MDRRRGGVLALVAAALVVVVGQGLTTDRFAGSPTAETVGSGPSVGDCLLEQPDPHVLFETNRAVGWATGGCDALHYGDIIAVIADPDDPSSWPYASEADAELVAEPDSLSTWSCQRAAAEYVGGPVVWSGALEWRALIRILGAVVRPTPRQEADGQHWRACVAMVATGQQPPDLSVLAVTASMKAAVVTGVMADALGYCTSLDGSGVPTTASESAPTHTRLRSWRWVSSVVRRSSGRT